MNCHARSSANPARSVSIHIRHCWRMNYYRLHVYMSTPACFNPHSPLLANELPARHGQAAGYRVSIHIRHCWRMNFSHTARSVCAGKHVSIHIRHCWRMNWQTGRCQSGPRGFNPHSPLLANELLPLVKPWLPLVFQSTFAIAGE